MDARQSRLGTSLLALLVLASGLACGHAEVPPAPAPETCPEGRAPCAEAVAPARETRARVARADRARKRAAFSEKVEQWRSALLARTASSSETAPSSLSDPEASVEEIADLGEGPPEGLERAVAVARAGSRAGTSKTERPPPELLLLGAACLLASDLPMLEARVREARRAAPADASELALAWLDGRDLEGRVGDARGATEADCDGPRAREARDLARSLVGPPPTSRAAVERHLRGLDRLARELVEHAGLSSGANGTGP